MDRDLMLRKFGAVELRKVFGGLICVSKLNILVVAVVFQVLPLVLNYPDLCLFALPFFL